ncbi:hypothetical protein OW763_05175 [Clostridium aestuarii]|uniref:Type II secretion system protein n=1 Tax=Clostridium aestuarii TaxID=338193 RepID=A0ABT4D055_9CLOT|nr:hypothetical protein [Clostridium aestuarii]MCY6483740.1 hypothetical protein [Clostridium aestuarii]
MLKLRKNEHKGIGIIDVVCSLAIFFVLLIFIFSIKMNALNLRNNNEKVVKYIEFVEALKNVIYYNHNFNEIETLVNTNKVVINKGDISLESIKNKDLEDIFVRNSSKEMPYLIMKVEEDDGEVVKLSLNLHFINKNKNKTIKCICYKGEY